MPGQEAKKIADAGNSPKKKEENRFRGITDDRRKVIILATAETTAVFLKDDQNIIMQHFSTNLNKKVIYARSVNEMLEITKHAAGKIDMMIIGPEFCSDKDLMIITQYVIDKYPVVYCSDDPTICEKYVVNTEMKGFVQMTKKLLTV